MIQCQVNGSGLYGPGFNLSFVYKRTFNVETH